MSGSQQLLLGGAPAAVPVDPYFYSVTSLLHGDGTNGAQNNTFLDSSTNNFTITRNGNTTQGSFSPFSQTGWGNYFNGTDAYLQTPANSALTPSTSTTPFTLEAWIYPTSSTTGNCIITQTLGTGIRYSLALGSSVSNLGGGLKVWFGFFTGISWSGLASSSSVSLDTWTHVAAVFTGSTCKIFINGVEDASGGPSTWTTAAASNVVLVGRRWDTFATPYYFQGYISNARVVIGTAVYTSAFTPSTTPLTAITNTQLLTCQSNRFIDNSSNAFAITVNGSPSVQPFSPFNPITAYSTGSVGGSGYFDGSGDSLRVSSGVTNQFTPGSAFTFEGWFYLNNSSASQVIFSVCGSTYDWNGSTGVLFQLYLVSGTLYWQSNGNGSAVSLSGTCPSLGNWHHIAVGYNGTTTRVWVDGASFVSGTPGYHVPTYSNILLGGDLSSANNYNGFMSNLRFVKGTDVYGASNTTITVPTSPVTAISNTQFLTNFTNGAIFDNAAVADYETVGNAQISTSVKKYGTGSIAFDGTGDYLLTDPPSAQLMAFGTGDFTVEMWVYFNAIGTNVYHFYDSRPASTDGAYPTLRTNASAQIEYVANSAVRITGLTLTTNTWYHVALCRTASQTKLFVNGTQTGSTYADTTNYLNAAARPLIGGSGFHVTTLSLNGYVDDVRISKGIGRYPYNFTPPTAEFPNIGGTVTLTADPYFDYTTLLLPGNGTNGAQNNTFVDSSTNAFSITRNGNTTQGTFSPFSQTGWGNYFDGTGDFLTVASSTAFGLGTGDFTIEMWIYPTANPANGPGTIFDLRTGVTATACASRVDASLNLIFYNGPGNTEFNVGTVQLNTWTHVAFVRASGSLRTYVNGTLSNTTALGGDLGSNQPCMIGNNQTAGYAWNGYQSNFRIVKGTAVYTSNFTPSTTPLTAISGTSLLTCQSNRFIDNSTNNFAITRNGDVSVQAFSPFNPTAAWSASTNGGSGYFDGSADFIYPADNSAFAYGTGDFTVECWVYPTSLPGSGSNVIIDQRESSPSGGGFSLEYTTTGRLDIATTTVVLSSSSNLTVNQWQHVAMARSGSTLKLFINGAEVGSVSNSTNLTSQRMTVGAYTSRAAAGSYFPGYINGVRLVKGTAVYTAAFTPPTAPLTAITNTSLLLNFTNAGIYDATSKNDLETVGNAQISTTQSKFGGSSMYFDGTGDYLYRANNPNVLGSGDWTIEGWYYQAGGSGYRVFVSTRTAADGGVAATVFFGLFNNVLFYDGSTSGGISIVGGTSISASTWNHVALVRYGSTVTMYLNGVSQGTATDSNNKSNADLWVGGQNTLYYLNGYIDDLRITKGIARYTSNFTPPTTAFLTL